MPVSEKKSNALWTALANLLGERISEEEMLQILACAGVNRHGLDPSMHRQDEVDLLRKKVQQLEQERNHYREITLALFRKQFPVSAWTDFDPQNYNIPAEDLLAEAQRGHQP